MDRSKFCWGLGQKRRARTSPPDLKWTGGLSSTDTFFLSSLIFQLSPGVPRLQLEVPSWTENAPIVEF